MDDAMMNESQKKLDQLFSDLAGDFDKANQQVKGYEKALQKRVRVFTQATQTPFSSKLRDDLPIIEAFEGISRALADECQKWASDIAQSGRNMSFREKVNDSMLVYVYGKVKSGKSSLGNFVAYGKHNPSLEYIESCPPVDFDVEALATVDEEEARKIELQKEATRKEHRFLVKFLEATACIQYFKKPGLTWVDSPGIHSKTSANGDLARQYLGSADLVIYTTSGRSAMQESDQKELLEIIKSNKPFVLVVTRCDFNDEDVDDDGNLIEELKMISPSDQEEIKNWSIQSITGVLEKAKSLGQLEGISLPNLNVNTITLSCLFAEKHLYDNKWECSGMQNFFDRLSTIARAEGVRIKRNAPLHNVINHILSIENGLNRISSIINNVDNQIVTLENKINTSYEQQKYRCSIEVKNKIISLAKEMYGQDKAFNDAVVRTTLNMMKVSCEEFAESVVSETLSVTKGLSIDVAPGTWKAFEDITQTVTYRVTKRRSGTILGAVVGAVGGLLIGGPAGAAIGAGLGSSAGSAVGNTIGSDKGSTVVVGDNRLEVGCDAAKKMCAMVEEYFDKVDNELKINCIYPLKTWLNNLKREIDLFFTFTKCTKLTVQKELER